MAVHSGLSNLAINPPKRFSHDRAHEAGCTDLRTVIPETSIVCIQIEFVRLGLTGSAFILLLDVQMVGLEKRCL